MRLKRAYGARVRVQLLDETIELDPRCCRCCKRGDDGHPLRVFEDGERSTCDCGLQNGDMAADAVGRC